MFRNINSAWFLSVALGGVAAAQPQTVSYYSGACTGTGSCDIAPSLPPQGFVLTDVIYGSSGNQITVQQVSGPNVVDKAVFAVDANNPSGTESYHLNSGIPFSGGFGIRIIPGASLPDPLRLTLVGYIPGTSASGSIPAVGGVGLAIMVVAMLAAGGYILKKRQATLAP